MLSRLLAIIIIIKVLSELCGQLHELWFAILVYPWPNPRIGCTYSDLSLLLSSMCSLAYLFSLRGYKYAWKNFSLSLLLACVGHDHAISIKSLLIYHVSTIFTIQKKKRKDHLLMLPLFKTHSYEPYKYKYYLVLYFSFFHYVH